MSGSVDHNLSSSQIAKIAHACSYLGHTKFFFKKKKRKKGPTFQNELDNHTTPPPSPPSKTHWSMMSSTTRLMMMRTLYHTQACDLICCACCTNLVWTLCVSLLSRRLWAKLKMMQTVVLVVTLLLQGWAFVSVTAHHELPRCRLLFNTPSENDERAAGGLNSQTNKASMPEGGHLQ